jgi:phage terminase small subunit
MSKNLPAVRRGAPRKPLSKRKMKGRARLDKPLTKVQEAFIVAYMVRFNATRAYMDTHPNASWATANTEGSRMCADPRISKEIDSLITKMKVRTGHSAEKTLELLSMTAHASISDVFDAHGTVMQLNQMPREVAYAVKKFEREEIVAVDPVSGERKVIGHTVKLEMKDTTGPLRLIGQHYRLFADTVQLTADDALLAALEQGAARALKG